MIPDMSERSRRWSIRAADYTAARLRWWAEVQQLPPGPPPGYVEDGDEDELPPGGVVTTVYRWPAARRPSQPPLRPSTLADCPHCNKGPHDTYVNGNNARCPTTGRPFYVPRWHVPGDSLDDRPYRRVTCRRGHTLTTRAKVGGRTSCPDCGLDVYVRRDAPVVATPPPRRRGPRPRPRVPVPELLDDWLDRVAPDDEDDDWRPPPTGSSDRGLAGWSSVAEMLTRGVVRGAPGTGSGVTLPGAPPAAQQRTRTSAARRTMHGLPVNLGRPPQRWGTMCAVGRADTGTWCTSPAVGGYVPTRAQQVVLELVPVDTPGTVPVCEGCVGRVLAAKRNRPAP